MYCIVAFIFSKRSIDFSCLPFTVTKVLLDSPSNVARAGGLIDLC